MKKKTTNSKGFFKNIIDGGQFVRVSGMNFIRMGGKGLDLMDTLDCKIDQWYASGCHAPVIYATHSDRKEGAWDHVTAIELSNFNVQHGFAAPMIDLQRAEQSLIWNGWIEHCDDPGNISNGQWVIQALNLETNKLPLKCHYSRIISSQLDVQAGPGLDLSEQGEHWLSDYESGQMFIENHGLNITGSLNVDYMTSQYSMDNRTGKPVWFLLGEMEIPEWTAQVQIKLVGSATDYSMSQTQKDFDLKTPEGNAILSLQNTKGVMQGSWYSQGAAPLSRMFIEKVKTNCVRIYLLIPAWTGFVKAFVTTNASDRFAKGVHFRFMKSYSAVDDQKARVLNSAADNCFHQHWTGNNSVGFGFNHNNELLLHVPHVDNNKMHVRVNGKLYAIALTPVSE